MLPRRPQSFPSTAIIISVVIGRKLRLSLSQSCEKLAQKLWFKAELPHSEPGTALLSAVALKVLIGTVMIVFLREPQKPGQADTDT